MVFKNVLRNKSLAEIKENCTLDGRSYCDVLTWYNLLYGIPGRPIDNLQPPTPPPPPASFPPPFHLLRKETLGTEYLYVNK